MDQQRKKESSGSFALVDNSATCFLQSFDTVGRMSDRNGVQHCATHSKGSLVISS